MSGLNRAADAVKQKMKLSFSDYSIPASEPEIKQTLPSPKQGTGRVDRLILGTNKTYYLNLDKRDLKLLNEMLKDRLETGEQVSRSDILSDALHLLYIQDS